MSESSSGHALWRDWFFDYGVFGSEGLCLVDGFFRGQKVFNKLCLPVIRVKYAKDEDWTGVTSVIGTGCGPYNDQITWDTEDFGENLNPISGPHHLVKLQCAGGPRYICTQEEITSSGVPNFRLSVYARIGAYHIVQSWTLDNEGGIRARVFSKGLSCNVDHHHHPYWRFDFALGSREVQRVEVFHRPDNGGDKLADIVTEGRVINSVFGRMLEYRITSVAHPEIGQIERPARVSIFPPDLNDTLGIVGPDTFSSVDGYVRKFRPEEDAPWPQPPHRDIAFPVHEPCVDSDIVFWSVCHLSHHADEGKHHWHSVGPDLVFTPMIRGALPPETFRKVTVKSSFGVKDFRVGKDLWKHKDFSDQVFVNPDASTAEVVRKVSRGDVTAELVVRCTWNIDSSISVEFTARLFDELEKVAEISQHFNVLRDTAMSWNGIHLVDHHWGDPDTADINFTVENMQQ